MKKFSKILCSMLVLVMLMSSNVCAYKMYSLDGRSVDVNYDDAQAWRNVGWYDQPVQQVYSLDGRTEIIYQSQLAAWKRVGWYEEPVTVMYALDGRTLICPTANVAANKKVDGKKEDYVRITVDVEGYRAKREETLRALARKQADKVLKYKRSVMLEPMNPYERRIIHSEVQTIKGVSTNSIGSENNRKIVIYLDNSADAE